MDVRGAAPALHHDRRSDQQPHRPGEDERITVLLPEALPIVTIGEDLLADKRHGIRFDDTSNSERTNPLSKQSRRFVAQIQIRVAARDKTRDPDARQTYQAKLQALREGMRRSNDTRTAGSENKHRDDHNERRAHRHKVILEGLRVPLRNARRFMM